MIKILRFFFQKFFSNFFFQNFFCLTFVCTFALLLICVIVMILHCVWFRNLFEQVNLNWIKIVEFFDLMCYVDFLLKFISYNDHLINIDTIVIIVLVLWCFSVWSKLFIFSIWICFQFFFEKKVQLKSACFFYANMNLWLILRWLVCWIWFGETYFDSNVDLKVCRVFALHFVDGGRAWRGPLHRILMRQCAMHRAIVIRVN